MYFVLYFFLHVAQSQNFEFHLYSGQVLSGTIVQASQNCALLKVPGEYKPLYRSTISSIHPIQSTTLQTSQRTDSEIIPSPKDMIAFSEEEFYKIFVEQKYQISDDIPSQGIAYTTILSSSLPFFLLKEKKSAFGYLIFEIFIGTTSVWLLQKQQKGVFFSGILSILAVRYWVGKTTYKKLHQKHRRYEQIQSLFKMYCSSQ